MLLITPVPAFAAKKNSDVIPDVRLLLIVLCHSHRALRVKMVANGLFDASFKTAAAKRGLPHHNFHLASAHHFDRFGSFNSADELQLRPFGEVKAIEHAVVAR